MEITYRFWNPEFHTTEKKLQYYTTAVEPVLYKLHEKSNTCFIDSATWYSTNTCSMPLRFNSGNGVFI
jgi:hypothetical protein